MVTLLNGHHAGSNGSIYSARILIQHQQKSHTKQQKTYKIPSII